MTNGLPEAPSVCGIAIHPDNPEVVFAGTQDGPYRSLNRGDSWERLDYPRVARPVWSFLFRPGDPTVMYLGTAPGEIFRSTDSGESWKRLDAASMGSNEVSMSFPTRVIALTADPNFPDEMYAALEVAGVIRSSDGGDTWEEITGSLAPSEDTLDLHGIQCAAALPHVVFITTRQGPFIGPERGSEWIPVDFGQFSEVTYTRDLKAAPHDPNMLYVSIGAAAAAATPEPCTGAVTCSGHSRGSTGTLRPIPTMMSVSVDPRAPATIGLRRPRRTGVPLQRRRRHLEQPSTALQRVGGAGHRRRLGTIGMVQCHQRGARRCAPAFCYDGATTTMLAVDLAGLTGHGNS